MKKWISNAMIVVFAAVFLVSAYFLISYFVEAGQEQGQFDDLAGLVEQIQKEQQEQTKPTDGNVPVDPDDTTPQETGPALVQVQDPETGETVEVLPEYAQLYTMNNDIVGWMKIEGTKINYPVMQTPDSTDYYLHRGFDKKYSYQGCLYAREVCDITTPSDNITIYGHNMKSGNMFAALHKYTSKSFWEENRYITFDTLTEHHTYEIIAVFNTTASVGKGFDYHLFVDAYDEAQFDEFVDTCKELAFYDTGVTASYGDKLITLSTCEYSQTNGRLVVVAKRIT